MLPDHNPMVHFRYCGQRDLTAHIIGHFFAAAMRPYVKLLRPRVVVVAAGAASRSSVR